MLFRSLILELSFFSDRTVMASKPLTDEEKKKQISVRGIAQVGLFCFYFTDNVYIFYNDLNKHVRKKSP